MWTVHDDFIVWLKLMMNYLSPLSEAVSLFLLIGKLSLHAVAGQLFDMHKNSGGILATCSLKK